MNKGSRTAKSIKNSSVALVFYCIDLLLQFYSRKIFLDYLGTEVLGLNTTATNLLSFLNLAELGIGTAVGFSLYKPFYDNDTQTISEIVSLQGKLYRRIAYVVIAAATILMCFFPIIFSKMELPLWYAYASFGVLLFSSLLSYFVNYKQILLSANQKEYKIQYSYKASILAKVLVQILAIRYFNHAYIWWLILEITFAIIASAVLNRTIRKTYPLIKTSPLSFKELNAKYPTIQTKIKQVFVHKIAGFAMNQISPLLIYTFTSLTIVALYGNYMLIVYGLARLSIALFNGVIAGIGNLVVEKDKHKIMSVFEEYFSIRFILETTMCFGLVTLAQPFVQLWLGEEYLLSTTTLYLIVGIMYLYISPGTVGTYLNAFGFYSDIWSPIIEIVSTICLSLVCGFYYGLNGVLCGLLISRICIYLFWKPFFLFKIKLKYGLWAYIRSYTIHLIWGCLCAIFTYFMMKYISFDQKNGFGIFLLYAIANILLYAILLISALYLCNCGIRLFLKRVTSFIKK